MSREGDDLVAERVVGRWRDDRAMQLLEVATALAAVLAALLLALAR